MSDGLFNEFDGISAKQWKQQIQFDLKGVDYNNTLIWKTNEGIDVKPFYHPDDFNEFSNITNSEASSWKICQSIFVADVKKSNQNAIYAIKNGTESIKFIIPSEDISITDLTENIDLDTTKIYLELQFLSTKFVEKLIAFNRKLNIQTDVVGNLAKSGNWFHNLKEDLSKSESILKTTDSLTINIDLYQNAGATLVQQLAYAMAHTNEYFHYIKNSLTKNTLVTFNVSVGSNHFFEIAKLRALRLLFKTLASQYDLETDCHIFATPTKRNKTIYDYNTNMLRTTTECMSAILGTANTVCNLPYDAIYHKGNKFASRMARNQLLILKHESYFDKVNNASDGSYYIETLTQQLAEKALALFKDIEANGGFLKQLKEGTIQRKIKESAAQEQEQFNTKELILLGTNKHVSVKDKMKNNLEIYPFVKTNPRKTLIEPIIEKRLAETLEQERLKNE